MKTETKAPTTIDQYIADFPPDVQKILQKVRTTVRQAAPGAQETIKYRMPTFMLNGNLVYFAGFRDHIGFYPVPSGIAAFEKELARRKQGRGSVQFSLDQPIPYDLIRKIVKLRVKENLQRAKVKARQK